MIGENGFRNCVEFLDDEDENSEMAAVEGEALLLWKEYGVDGSSTCFSQRIPVSPTDLAQWLLYSLDDPTKYRTWTANRTDATGINEDGSLAALLGPPPREFDREDVRAMCGGTFPHGDGFEWNRVDTFRLEGELLEPYAGDEILPGPALRVTITEAPFELTRFSEKALAAETAESELAAMPSEMQVCETPQIRPCDPETTPTLKRAGDGVVIDWVDSEGLKRWCIFSLRFGMPEITEVIGGTKIDAKVVCIGKDGTRNPGIRVQYVPLPKHFIDWALGHPVTDKHPGFLCMYGPEDNRRTFDPLERPTLDSYEAAHMA